MTLLLRIGFIAALFGIAIAQAAFGIAHAQPKEPLAHCHMAEVCTMVPARTIACPPASQQTRPCTPQTVPEHKSCSMVKVCDN